MSAAKIHEEAARRLERTIDDLRARIAELEAEVRGLRGRLAIAEGFHTVAVRERDLERQRALRAEETVAAALSIERRIAAEMPGREDPPPPLPAVPRRSNGACG